MQRPLEGIRILDLTQGLAGPFGAMMLADFGAEVIKVEAPKGDLTRHSPPHYIDGTSLYFIANNQNKKSVVIDLKSSEGRAVFRELVRHSDAVYYNFGPGVAERLQIDHASLLKLNPSIITARVEGLGSRNPEPDRRMVDLIAQAAAGAMSITGESGRPPVRAGVPTADLSAGLFSLIGLLAALVGRKADNKGREVETTLFHSQLSLLNYMAAYSLYSGTSPAPVGSGHVSTVPSQAFEASDGWMVIDAGLDNHFREFCEVLDLPELSKSEKYATRKMRNEHRVELLEILSARLKKKPIAHWLSKLQPMGIPCAKTNTILEALQEPAVQTYNFVRTVPYGEEKPKVLGTPIWFDGNLERPAPHVPRLGEHTREVLEDLLRYDAKKIDELIAGGIVCVDARPLKAAS